MAQCFVADRFQPLPGPSRRDRLLRPRCYGAVPRPAWTWHGAVLPAGVPAALRDGHDPQAILTPREAPAVLLTLAAIIEARDPYMSGHSRRTGWMAARLGRQIGLDEPAVELLYLAGILHDIGKLGIPEAVLNKRTALTDDEMALIRRHPEIGCEMLRPLAWLEPLLPAIRHHHENYDGTGYPDGLRAEQIPLAARILRVVDIYDALTSPRPYRPPLGPRAARDVLKSGAGSITDPRLTLTFLAMIGEPAGLLPLVAS